VAAQNDLSHRRALTQKVGGLRSGNSADAASGSLERGAPFDAQFGQPAPNQPDSTASSFGNPGASLYLELLLLFCFLS
jgi:hypothetical protein